MMRLKPALPVLIAVFTLMLCSTDAMAMYNPKLGRFMQRDWMIYVDSYNSYQYEKSHPIQRLDWSGYCSESNHEEHIVTVPNFPRTFPAEFYPEGPPRKEGKRLWDGESKSHLYANAGGYRLVSIDDTSNLAESVNDELDEMCPDKKNCVKYLDVIGHGNKGFFVPTTTVGVGNSTIDSNIIDKYSKHIPQEFGNIKFCEPCMITIRTCHSGFDRILLEVIAAETGCNVRGFIHTTSPGQDGALPGYGRRSPVGPDVFVPASPIDRGSTDIQGA
ncbi:hypothetical protein JD969_04510 [Planctomycetota bacterium]|nr:hypothetical protein JD969_04510 [Planctomycetota bacterium]